MATDAEAVAAGFKMPANEDMIRDGDDAIRQNARAVLDLIAKTKIGMMRDGGRANAAAGTGGTADALTTNGMYWSVWSAAEATALGLPKPAQGIILTYTFGSAAAPSVIQQWIPLVSPSEIWQRPRFSGGFADWSRIGDTAHATKLVPYALSAGNASGTDKAASRTFRLPLRLPVAPKRFRVHIQNRNPRSGTKYTGSLSFEGLGIHQHSGVVTPANEGNLASGPFPLAGAFTTPANGSEWVSPWTSYEILPNVEYLLTGGYTCAAGQSNFAGVSGGWITDNAADWNVPAPAGVRLTAAAPLFIWLELEVDADTPTVAYFGDSLMCGLSSRLPVFDSPAYAHARMNGHLPVLYADSGATMNIYTDYAAEPWHRFGVDNFLRTNALVWEMGSNDIFGGADLPTLKARFETVRRRFAAKVSNTLALLTVLPRHEGSAPEEAVRKEWNEYLMTELPGRAAVAVDGAAAITAPDGATLDKRFSASPTDIHLTAAGYARYAHLIPPMHD